MKKLGIKKPKTTQHAPNVSSLGLGSITSGKSDRTTYRSVSVSKIEKHSNPREVPLTIDEARSVTWPDPRKVGDIETELQAILENHDWFNKRLAANQKKIIDFMSEINTLAFSILESGQAQSVVLNQEDEALEKYTIIAGERRCISVIYLGELQKTVKAEVYLGHMTEIQKARICDAENLKEGLNFAGIMRAKLRLYDALSDDEKNVSSEQLAKVFSYKSKASAQLVVKIANDKNRDEIMQKAETLDWGYRECREYMYPAPKPEQKKPVANAKPTLNSYGFSISTKTDVSALSSLVSLAAKSDKTLLKGIKDKDLSDAKALKSVLEEWLAANR